MMRRLSIAAECSELTENGALQQGSQRQAHPPRIPDSALAKL
jgi:hypothetical protein